MAIQFLTADQVAEAIGVSRSTAYRIIKRLNQELENKGYIMRTVLRQFFQQKLQLRHIVDAGRSGKGTVHQIMGNVGFQKSFRHIDHACIRITDKMRRASGGGAFRLTGRRKPDVFGSVLFRWIILILQRHIQTDLKAADTPVFISERIEEEALSAYAP